MVPDRHPCTTPRINSSKKILYLPAKHRPRALRCADGPGKLVLRRINNPLPRWMRAGPTPLDERPPMLCDQRSARPRRRYPFRDRMYDLHFARIAVAGHLAIKTCPSYDIPQTVPFRMARGYHNTSNRYRETSTRCCASLATRVTGF